MKLRNTLKTTLLVGLFIVLTALTACGQKAITTGELSIHENVFGSIALEISIDSFEKLGFEPGDSVDIKLSNGHEIKDIPYHTGYYVKLGMPVLVAYYGDTNITFAFKTGEKAWEVFGMSEKNTGCVTLNETGKYKARELLLHQKYVNNRSDFASDEIFANYRVMSGGKLKKNKFYRSCSPCDNKYNRAKYADKLIKRDNINFVFNLADNTEQYNKHITKSDFKSDYYKSLHDKGRVILTGLAPNFYSNKSKKIIADALKNMPNINGKILFHCAEGKDRTGFVCALVEALAGANYDEIEADYMKTYDNYYHVNKKDTPDKYNAIIEAYFLDIMEAISGEKDEGKIKKTNLKTGAINYLKSCGLTDSTIEKIILSCTE